MVTTTRKKAQAEDGEDAADKKNRAKPLLWDQNKSWTHTAIEYLLQNPTFRLKLFSDSSSDAKEEDRRKVQAKEGKTILYAELAKVIFEHADVADDIKEAYIKNPTRFAKSTQQQFIRLKKTYQEYRNQFKVTGEGVMPDDTARNLSEKIKEKWVFYEDLHMMWSELPNYNTVGVSNSTPGQNFALRAGALFGGRVSSPEASSGADEYDMEPDPVKFERGDDELDSSSVADVNDHGDPISSDWDRDLKLSSNTSKRVKEEPRLTSISDKDKKGKKLAGDDKSKKRSISNSLDDIHTLELKDAATRRAEKTAIRLKELDLAQKKQELEREKFQAKVQIQANKHALEARKHEFNMQTCKVGHCSAWQSPSPFF